MSMAAGARPGQATMASRTAAMQMGRQGAGLAGQQSLAGIAERNAAAQTLAGLNLQQRGQDINYSTGQRGLGIQGQSALEQARLGRYQSDMQAPSNTEVLLGGLSGVMGAYGMSGGGGG
jgi:hypothetical protein